jgi:hypothetical protein
MKWLGIIAVAIAGLVAAYSVIYPTTSYRFRITLNVDTPQGLKSGSSVMEVQDRRYPAWTTLGSGTGQSSLTGEAVFVDLGPGASGNPRNVIALLALGPQGENVDFYLLPSLAFGRLWKQKVDSANYRGSGGELPKLPVGTNAELSGDLIPTLVTFVDLNDPNTARTVRPDGFSQAFGPSFALHDAKIEMVSAGTWPLTLLGFSGEPLTRGIGVKVPALRQLIADNKSFRIKRAGDAFRVNSGQLQQGF